MLASWGENAACKTQELCQCMPQARPPLPETLAGQRFAVLRRRNEIRGMPLIRVDSGCARLVPAHRESAYTSPAGSKPAPLLCNTGHTTYSAIMAATEATLERLPPDLAPTAGGEMPSVSEHRTA
jgi:hypothetical protein